MADPSAPVSGGFPARVTLTNSGAGPAQVDAFSWTGESDDLAAGPRGAGNPTPDARGLGVRTFTVGPGVCSDGESFVWQFAVDTWEDQSHPVPVRHLLLLDVGQDGTDDYAVLNADASGLGTISDGRQVAWAVDLATGQATGRFFAGHATNTGNTTLTVCAEQLGLSFRDVFPPTYTDVSLDTLDFYFGGTGDVVDGLTIAPFGERYFTLIAGDIPAGSTGDLLVYDYGPLPGVTPDLRVMAITNGQRAGSSGGSTDDTDTRYLPGSSPDD